MNNIIISQFVYFLVYVLLQIFFIRKLVLFDVAFCFLYINFIVSFTKEIDKILLMLMAFVLGITIDVFYNTLGIQTAACVLIAFARPYILQLFSQKDKNNEVNLREMGLINFSLYLLAMIFLHSFVVFSIEVGNISLFMNTMVRIMASTLFTFVVILTFQFLFFSQTKSI